MDNEQLLLCKLAEECSEIIKLCMKAQQFGLDSIDPVTGKSNIELICGEIDDFNGCIFLLTNTTLLQYEPSFEAVVAKCEKILKYKGISISLGRVKDD